MNCSPKKLKKFGNQKINLFLHIASRKDNRKISKSEKISFSQIKVKSDYFSLMNINNFLLFSVKLNVILYKLAL